MCIPPWSFRKTTILFVYTFTVTSYQHRSLALAALTSQTWLPILSKPNSEKQEKKEIYSMWPLSKDEQRDLVTPPSLMESEHEGTV